MDPSPPVLFPPGRSVCQGVGMDAMRGRGGGRDEQGARLMARARVMARARLMARARGAA